MQFAERIKLGQLLSNLEQLINIFIFLLNYIVHEKLEPAQKIFDRQNRSALKSSDRA